MIYQDFCFKLKYGLALSVLLFPLKGIAMNIDLSLPLSDKQVEVLTDASERELGKSGGGFFFQNNIRNPHYLFIGHIDPQPNGAGFVSAWISIDTQRISDNTFVKIDVEPAPGDDFQYQVILQPEGVDKEISYIASFNPSNQKHLYQFSVNDFIPNYRGRVLTDVPKLKGNRLKKVGVRVVGRLGDDTFQKGPFALKLYQISVE